MKTLLIWSSLVLCVFLCTSYGQTTEADFQSQAVLSYPDLVVKGSAFNQAFVQLYQRPKAEGDPELQQPNWPLLLANEVAASLGVKSAAPNAVAQATPQAPQPNLVQERMNNYVNPLDAPGGDRGVEGSGSLDQPSEQRWRVSGKVFQKLDDGVLVIGAARESGITKASGTFFLSGHPDFATLVENSQIKRMGVCTGTYQYTDVDGASRTVAAFKYYSEQ